MKESKKTLDIYSCSVCGSEFFEDYKCLDHEREHACEHKNPKVTVKADYDSITITNRCTDCRHNIGDIYIPCRRYNQSDIWDGFVYLREELEELRDERHRK